METKRLISYLPAVLQEVRELEAVTDAEQPEIDLSWRQLEDVFRNQFIPTATEYGIARWERMLKIYPGIGATLEGRRIELLIRLQERVPFTMTRLREMLTNICGEDGYSIDLEHTIYILSVMVTVQDNYVLQAVAELLKRVVPANLLTELFWQIPLSVKSSNSLSFFNMHLHYRFPWKYNDQIVRMNGKYLMDGTILMDNELPPDFLMDSFSFSVAKKFEGKFTGLVIGSEPVRLRNKTVIAQRGFEVLASVQNHREADMDMEISMSVTNTQNLSVCLTIDKMYTMDGSVLMDGSRLMDASIIEEEL